MQRDDGGAVYLRLSTRALDQAQRQITPQLERDITSGAYWLREPGPNAELVIAYTGAVAPEAIEATGLLGESRRDIGLLAVTSADRLHAGWTSARKQRRNGGPRELSHIERLLDPLPRNCGIVTVIVDDLYAHYGLDTNSIIDAAGSLTFGAPIRHRKIAI
jgi:pyruvate dehydrogenase E1 component